MEQTVANLKGLEQTLEVLRNDLAWLAQSIGHPQAAQAVLAPTRLNVPVYGIPNVPQYGNFSQAGFQTPYAGIGTPFGVPAGIPPYAYPQVGNPYVTGFTGAPINGIGPTPFMGLYR